MALTKVTVIDKREILEDGSIQVRRATYIEEDGKRISEPTYHRSAYVPGETIDHEDAVVKRVASAEWTPEVIKAYREKIASKLVRPVKG